MWMRRLVALGVLAVSAGLAGCEDKLVVTNPNSGDTRRVLGTPDDAEALIAGYYKRWHSGVYGATPDLQGMANNFSLMNYSSLANACQNSHLPFSGATNFNIIGNTCATEQSRLYFYMAEVDRVASSFLGQLKGGLTLGSQARDLRAKAWAEFLRGLARGYVSLMHDSAAVVTEDMTSEDQGVMTGYRAVNDSAMAAFQRAIDYAQTPATGDNGFPIPNAWLPSPTNWTVAEFVRLIRSYRARIRASVARTPAERAALDWAAIIADAQNGITADHRIITSTTVGPSNAWRSTYNPGGSVWHQVPPFFIGMADVSGSYAAWIATPIGQRGAGNTGFFMVTPDLRFPQGATRAAQQADFPLSTCQTPATTCKRYFLNRTSGGDQFAGDGWAYSNYDFARFQSWRVAGDAGSAQNGATELMVKTEMDMLQAEGLIRQGNYAAAAALVNVTRTRNGLPAITAFDLTTPVPGEANCVPKIPVAPSFRTLACGNLWEAMKYEKRIETAYVHYTPWFLDHRGWGDLPEGVPLFWAVPYQELQARGYTADKIYGAGAGTGNAPNSVSGKSTYGW